MHNGTAITQFIIEQQRRNAGATGDSTPLLNDSVTARKVISNRMSFVVEQAGGMSSTGRERIVEVEPRGLHQRVPVILGSREHVERFVSYHAE